MTAVSPSVPRWVDGFLLAKRAEGLSAGTLHNIYARRLTHFVDYCACRHVATLDAIDPTLIPAYLLHLDETGHNPGGCHQFYRVLKIFLRWYEAEAAPDGWRNPIQRLPPAAALEAGFAPAPRAGLPVHPTPLNGRQRRLAELDRLLRDLQCRLITLVGPGGIGKTRLAVEGPPLALCLEPASCRQRRRG